MPRAKASPKFTDLNRRPDVQYLVAFGASIGVFLAVGFISGAVSMLLPYYKLFPIPSLTDPRPNLIWINLAISVLSTVIPAILYAGGFWLFGQGMQKLGVKKIKSHALRLGALLAGSLLMLMIASDSILTQTAFISISADNQVLIDCAYVFLTGLWFVAGWWLVRRQSAAK